MINKKILHCQSLVLLSHSQVSEPLGLFLLNKKCSPVVLILYIKNHAPCMAQTTHLASFGPFFFPCCPTRCEDVKGLATLLGSAKTGAGLGTRPLRDATGSADDFDMGDGRR